MDPSSIITQVRRSDDETNNFHGPAQNTSNEKTVTSKPKRPTLFKQFFCCFRRPSDRNCSQNRNKNNNCREPVLPPPSPRPDDTQNLTSSPVPDTRIPEPGCLLPFPRPQDKNKKCIVIDLDETLVHSSFVPVNNPDFIIPVEIDGTIHQVYVLKRPHVDEFLRRMGEMFECVLFTASLGKYADPVTDLLDKWGVFKSRLFRESCVFHRGNYVKDLSRLGRDLKNVIIIDNSPASYLFHPENAVPILTWFDDPLDTELLNLLPLFERLSAGGPSLDVYSFLTSNNIGAERFYSNNGAITTIQIINQQARGKGPAD